MYMCTWFLYTILFICLSAQEHGECSLFFSCGWEGNQFGWDTIIGMYKWECERRSNGNARMVPKLREIHVLRDSWTKPNFLPAKIMQVCLHVYSVVYLGENLM